MHIKTLTVGAVVAVAFLVQSAVAIPTNNLALWLKASVGVEEATAVAAQNNDFISAWRDQSGNGFDAFPTPISGNPASYYKPTFVTNGVNNQPAVLFGLGPGNNEYSRLALTTPLLTGTGDFQIFAVVKFGTATPNGEKVIGSNNGASNPAGLEYDSNVKTQQVTTAAPLKGTNIVVDGAWHLFEARRVSGTASLWLDNVQEASGSFPYGIGGSLNWTIGNGADYSSGGDFGYMAEQIVYNNSLSSNNINFVVRRLADDYNLAIIPEPSPTTLALLTIAFGAIIARLKRRP